MSERLKPHQANAVKVGLMRSLTDKFVHPYRLPNVFDGIWINDAQKRAYLRRLAERGLIRFAYHERGWYRYNTYSRLRPSDENYTAMQTLIGETNELPY